MYRENEWDFIDKEETAEEEVVEARGSVQRKDGIKRIKEILNFISDEVGCDFPNNFATKLYDQSNSKESFSLNKNHALGIIEDWRIWEPFVLHSDVSRYIKHKLEVFCRIHCGVTYGFNRGEATAKSFVGNHATVVETIPDNMYTIIHSSGLVSLNGVTCPVDSNDPRAAFTSRRKPKKSSHYSLN